MVQDFAAVSDDGAVSMAQPGSGSPDRTDPARATGDVSGGARTGRVPRDARPGRRHRRCRRRRPEPGGGDRAAGRVEPRRGGGRRRPRPDAGARGAVPDPPRRARSTSRCCSAARPWCCSRSAATPPAGSVASPWCPTSSSSSSPRSAWWRCCGSRNPGIGASLALIVGLVTWIVTLRMLTAPLLGEIPGHAAADLAAPRLPEALGLGGRRGRRAQLRRPDGQAAVGARWSRPAGCCGCRCTAARCLPVSRSGCPGIEPWRTPNDDFYIIHTALAPPSISPEDWQLRIHGHGRPGADDQLPGPDRPPAHRGLGDAVLRLQRGGRGPDRQRLVVRRAHPGPAGRGRREARRRRGAADLARTAGTAARRSRR